MGLCIVLSLQLWSLTVQVQSVYTTLRLPPAFLRLARAQDSTSARCAEPNDRKRLPKLCTEKLTSTKGRN